MTHTQKAVHSPTVLVLTPAIGGDYFGQLLDGIAREVGRANGRLVVVETLPASAPRDDEGAAGDFSTEVAWSQVDGVVCVTSAVNADYLQRLRDAGKPLVLLSNAELEGFRAPVARPDNRGGTVAAVEHLIGHGHTSIGFVGNLKQPDLFDRYDAYRKTLENHGLSPDPEFLFVTPDNSESGGAVAAQAMLAGASRPTAVMIATDRNAIGMMGALTEAGLDLPRDLAIAAFDNISASTFTTPALSTVDQRFDAVGALAGRLVIAHIRGEDVSHTTYRTEPPSFLVRESCGCDVLTPYGEKSGEWSPRISPQLLRDRLEGLLIRELVTGNDETDAGIREAIADVIAKMGVVLDNGGAVSTEQIQAVTNSLKRLTSRPDTWRRLTDGVKEYAQRAEGLEGGDWHGTSPTFARVATALWKAQAGALHLQSELTNAAVAEQYAVDAGLIDTTSADPRDLEWLNVTHVHAAALALWEGDPTSGQLKVVGTHGSTEGQSNLADIVGDVMPSGNFPPDVLLESCERGRREVCVVVPVKTAEQDWGMLAVVARIDPSAARETYQHWASLLCAALESQRLQEEVRRSALYDSLTGLPNRSLFVTQLEHALATWELSKTPFAVLFVDLDGFKLVNDSLGHQMGDRVLEAVGADITSELRAVDTGARFGGDEFVVLLADTEPDAAVMAAHRLQATLSQVHDFDGHEIAMRASIGIATSAFEYKSAEEVLRDADSAMYRAKRSGPGTVDLFDAPMHADAVHRAALTREIHQGLQADEFEVHYQPIVNLASGHTDSFEALVRWRHPERGLLLPGEFVPFMEEKALTIQFGHWVLEEVCKQLDAWAPKVVNVSINVSDKEFWSQDLLAHVLATLRRYNLPPDRLTLEITESVLMRHPDMSLRMVDTMHESGLRLHIDDFGTGYSSLFTLHQFPVDAFKIDQSFIQTLTTAENSAELITSLVTLGKTLGLSVVAEGVETDEQLAFLQQIGCSTAQGYLFMPAVTGDQATELLEQAERGGNTGSEPVVEPER